VVKEWIGKLAERQGVGGINNYAQRCALFDDMGSGGDKYLLIKRDDHHGEANRLKK